MPKKLVCVLGSEYYSDHADSRILANQMASIQTEQPVYLVQVKIPLKEEQKQPKPNGFKALLRRKSPKKTAPGPPPYTEAVSEAYHEFLTRWYEPGDEIVIFPITGVEGDWEVLREGSRVLAEHLHAGTEPPRVTRDPDPVADADDSQDIFGDKPEEQFPNHMLGKRVECSFAIVYRVLNPVSEINNFLLDEFPPSVKHIFTFNWATGRENYCSTYRDDTGMITSREVCYFRNIQWHIPSVVNSTMGFIRYKREHTSAWQWIKPSTPRTLASLPAPFIPECPPTPILCSSPAPRKSKFSWGIGRKSSSKSRGSTAPSIGAPRRSSTLRTAFTTTHRSSSLFSALSNTPLVSPPTSMTPEPIPEYAADLTQSRASTTLTQISRESSDFSQSSRTSLDSNDPILREAYISLPGMTKHQVWTYPAFGDRKDNYGLPERVVWRSSRD